MKPLCPIFIYEPIDMSIYNSVEDAEKDLEAIDVLENTYRSYDACGRHLKLEVITEDEYQIVKVKLAEIEPTHINELKADLNEYLIATGDIETNESELSTLIELSKKHISIIPETGGQVLKSFFSDMSPFKKRG